VRLPQCTQEERRLVESALLEQPLSDLLHSPEGEKHLDAALVLA
jgi:hypothetical protein